MSDKKLPQPGEWWRQRDGQIAYVVGRRPACDDDTLWPLIVTDPYGVCREPLTADGFLDNSHIPCDQDLVEYLPDCTGWDWVPEVWPKWYVHRDANQQWYVRRYNSNNAVMVLGFAPDWDEPWYTEWDGHAKAGFWIEVTEAEAKARLTPEVLKCHDCGEPVNDGHEDLCQMAWIEIGNPDHVLRSRIDQLQLSSGGWIPVEGMTGETIHESLRCFGYGSVRCRRKDLPPVPVPVPVPAKTKIPLRVFTAKAISNPHSSGYWRLLVLREESPMDRHDYAEVHGLNLYIENPSASGSADDTEED